MPILRSLLVVVSLVAGVGLLGQGNPVAAQPWIDQFPSYSIDRNSPSSRSQGGALADPADILFNPSLGGIVGIPCASLGLTGCTGVAAPPYDDLDALSYGADFGQYTSDQGYVGFSVERGSVGLANTAVNYEAATCATAEPEADEFATQLDGNNSRVFDGNGTDCVTGGVLPGMGLQEPNDDDLDALDGHDLYFVDWTPPDGVPDQEVYFSLDGASPTLTAKGWSAADILVTIGGALPTVYATAAQLGLIAGDDVDGLCLAETSWPPGSPGRKTFDPDGVVSSKDFLFYTITASSPSIIDTVAPDLVPDAATIMYVQSSGVAIPIDPAAALGLAASTDDLDAMKCVKGLVDIAIETYTVTLPGGTVAEVGGETQTLNMTVGEWETLTVLEEKHYAEQYGFEGELSPPSVISQVWWAVSGAIPSQINVRWLPEDGGDDTCTFDGEEVDCETGDPATGDINDLEFEIMLDYCVVVPVTREVMLECKLPGEYRITFENVEVPLGANDLNPSNSDLDIDLDIVCQPQEVVIGGIAEAPDVEASPLETTGSAGGSSSPPYAAIAGVAAAAIAIAASGGWYARRRWLS
jgi:hypothetical protein